MESWVKIPDLVPDLGAGTIPSSKIRQLGMEVVKRRKINSPV